jgi:hypothetical protein
MQGLGVAACLFLLECYKVFTDTSRPSTSSFNEVDEDLKDLLQSSSQAYTVNATAAPLPAHLLLPHAGVWRPETSIEETHLTQHSTHTAHTQHTQQRPSLRTSYRVAADVCWRANHLLSEVHQLLPPCVKVVDAVCGSLPGVWLIAEAIPQQVY